MQTGLKFIFTQGQTSLKKQPNQTEETLRPRQIQRTVNKRDIHSYRALTFSFYITAGMVSRQINRQTPIKKTARNKQNEI